MDLTARVAAGSSFNELVEAHAADSFGSEGPIDEALIAPLRDLGPDDFQQLIRLFLDEATLRVARLRAFQAQGDAASLRGVAHSLRGTSAAFGAKQLAALCAEIEETAPREDTIGLSRLVDAVTTEFDRVRASLTEELR